MRPRIRRGWMIIGACIGALFCLLIALVASFPYRDTLTALLAPRQLKLTYSAQQASIPLGVTLKDVRLLSTATRPERLLLAGDSLTLRPTLSSLLFGAPALSAVAAIYGGRVRATVEQRGALVATSFAFDGIDLASSQPLRQLDVGLDGSISGTGTADLQSATPADNHADLRFNGQSVVLHVADGFPPITLGGVDGRVLLEHGTLNFIQVESRGGDFAIRADGALTLAEDPDDAELHARVFLTPNPSGRDHFGFFLHFLPHSPAAGPYYIDGPLDAPSIH